MRHVGVVGAGIVGLAVARELAHTREDMHVTVLDKEDDVGTHQTGHNSGVVHAGLYYPSGSLKSRLCRRGMSMLRQYCMERDLPYEEVGKLVVAVTESEVPALLDLQSRARQNEVPGLKWLDATGIRDREPNAAGVAALHSPRTAITDFRAVAKSFASDVGKSGGRVVLNAAVAKVQQDNHGVTVGTAADEFRFDQVILCTGLQADRVSRLAGDTADPVIVPFRGEYLAVAADRQDLVNGLIYPVPDPEYPFLGVHFSRRVGGALDIGPNAVLALSREGYRRADVNPRDVTEVLGTSGFRRLARRHWRAGLAEMAGSASRHVFVRRAQRYVPSLTVADVMPGTAGVRAQALDSLGTLIDDFSIHHIGRVTAVRNAPSPAATSSMAIAAHIVDQLGLGARCDPTD